VTEAEDPISIRDYEHLAERTLDPGVFGFFAGGAADECTLRDNIEAFERWSLQPRVLTDVAEVDPATTVFGELISMPAVVAPVAFLRLVHAEGELAAARAAATAGTIYCLSTLATASPAEVAAAAPDGVCWLQLYVFRDRGVTRALIDQAVDAGFRAIVVTVDAPYLGRRERDLRTGFRIPAEFEVPSFVAAVGGQRSATPADMVRLFDPSLTWRDIDELASTSDLPVVVKGVLTGADGRLAVEHGAAAVAVSNHGGRQLDTVPASLDALQEVAQAISGAVPVFVDGGIRRGTDIVKALALGAQTVMVGRPIAWGLAARGEAGAQHVLELLRDEVKLALALVGCCSPHEVLTEHVVRAARLSR
jgi:isopentenyl diphosphate isomerase/L-lactate dehydrogenase-like FMN-dependent dehydrogenase